MDEMRDLVAQWRQRDDVNRRRNGVTNGMKVMDGRRDREKKERIEFRNKWEAEI